MDYFLFIYSIVLTLIFGACGFGYILLYKREGQGRDLWIAVMFLIFTCDNLLLSMREMIPAFDQYYNDIVAATPFPNNLITAAMIFSYRMVVAYAFDTIPSKGERLCQAALLLALAAATALSAHPAARICVFAINQFCVACILVFAFRGLARKKRDMSAGTHRLWLTLLILSALTHLAGAVENFLRVIRNLSAAAANSRAISLEIFGLIVAAFAIYHIFAVLSSPKKGLSQEEVLELFCSRYGLTAREAELVPLLLEGAQNSEICERFYISLNTVKVHTHNIYQKLGIERRSQLSAKYAEFSAQYK